MILYEKYIVKEDYKISESTMFISPYFHVDFRSKIIDEKGIFLTSKRPKDLLEEACIRDGSSFDGKRKAVIQKLNYKVRTPIPVSPNDFIYAFPTTSFLSYECKWFFANTIIDIRPLDENTSEIEFRNGYRMKCNLSTKLLNKQREKTALCMYVFSPYRKLNIQFTPVLD